MVNGLHFIALIYLNGTQSTSIYCVSFNRLYTSGGGAAVEGTGLPVKKSNSCFSLAHRHFDGWIIGVGGSNPQPRD